MKTKEVIKRYSGPLIGIIDKGTAALKVSRKKDNCKIGRKAELSVMIARMSVYGGSASQLLISIPGQGSAVVDIGNIKMQTLFLIGLTPNEASLLKKELDTLFTTHM